MSEKSRKAIAAREQRNRDMRRPAEPKPRHRRRTRKVEAEPDRGLPAGDGEQGQPPEGDQA